MTTEPQESRSLEAFGEAIPEPPAVDLGMIDVLAKLMTPAAGKPDGVASLATDRGGIRLRAAGRDGGALQKLDGLNDETVVEIELEAGVRLWTSYAGLPELFERSAGRDASGSNTISLPGGLRGKSGTGPIQLPGGLRGATGSGSIRLPPLIGAGTGRGRDSGFPVAAVRAFDLPETTLHTLLKAAAGLTAELVLECLGQLHPAFGTLLKPLQDKIAEEISASVRTLAGQTGALALCKLLELFQVYRPGLHLWQGDALVPLQRPVVGTQPILLLIHGTAGTTAASFGALRRQDGLWKDLVQRYGENRILAFEHRTLTQGPIDNALTLLQALPGDARLHVLSHGAGGLVAEFLARGQRADGKPAFDRVDWELLEKLKASDLRKPLEALSDKLQEKRPKIERFVRVACPAAGTTLASNKLDRWTSFVLDLLGHIPALTGNPVYGFTKSVLVTAIATKAEPKILPGLEAQMPGSPLIRLLNRADIATTADLSVVAGDIEGDGLWGRLKLLLPDAFFGGDHDLIVDTASMQGGLRRAASDVGGEGARYRVFQAPDVHHFRYGQNRDSALAIHDGLLRGKDDCAGFAPLIPDDQPLIAPRGSRDTDQPILFILPGIAGSHLKAGGDWIWLGPSIVFGGYQRLAFDTKEPITTYGIFGRYYDDLATYMASGCLVEPFAYDWRLSVQVEARRLADRLRRALKETNAAVRLLAHSMGGLVARLALAQDPSLASALKAREGARLVMLGTPNFGSFAMARHLLGQSDFLSQLELLDWRTDTVELAAILGAYPGTLELLPSSLRGDGTPLDLYDWVTWQRLWTLDPFDDAGYDAPERTALQTASATRRLLDATPFDPDFMVYVAGVGTSTPSGILVDGTTGNFLETDAGDGTVTWAEGVPPGFKAYYAAAVHGDLPRFQAAFPAYRELLETGATRLLPTQPPGLRGRRGLAVVLPPSPEPALVPSAAVAEAIVMGASLARAPAPPPPVRLRIAHGDLTFAAHPVLVGHYAGDTLAGTEAALDRRLEGRLRQRHDLALYPGPVGTYAGVFDPGAKPGRGAVVTGLGEAGMLGDADLRRAVSTGITAYATLLGERGTEGEVGLSLPIVGSGEGGLSLRSALRAILEGVLEANKLLGNASPTRQLPRLGEIQIIELFRDRALQATHCLDALLKDEMVLAGRFSFDGELTTTPTGETRPFVTEDESWARRIAVEVQEPGRVLRFTASGERARAEVAQLPEQRELADRFIEAAISRATFERPQANPGITLFELLLPNVLKPYFRGDRPVVLNLNEGAARYPWEMLVDRRTGDGRPLAVVTEFVRSLQVARYRLVPEEARDDRALVVGDPTSHAFPPLPGARREADSVALLLRGTSFTVEEFITESSPAFGPTDVLSALLGNDYRIVHLAAHGDRKLKPDGTCWTGMVLGDGSFLTADLVRQMRSVPELVFLNCCHLGVTGEALRGTGSPQDDTPTASLATALIGMGVRAVVGAGWAVNDEAALLFAQTFYGQMLAGERFAAAVHDARRVVYDSFPMTTTWGAYQAYGDPDYRLRRLDGTIVRSRKPLRFAAPVEAAMALRTGSARANAAIDDEADAKVAEEVDAILTSVAEAGWRKPGKVERRPRPPKSGRRKRKEPAPPPLPPTWDWTDGELAFAAGEALGALRRFPEAIQALKAAVRLERSLAPVRAIELLANFQARDAADRVDELGLDTAKAEIAEARASIDALGKLAGWTPERWSLLASTWKREAQIERNRASRVKALEHMAAAYADAANRAAALKADERYPAMNLLLAQLLLHAVAGTLADLPPDWEPNVRAYRGLPGTEPSLWDRLADADADYLLALSRPTGQDAATLATGYKSILTLGSSASQRSTVREHLNAIAAILEDAVAKEASTLAIAVASAYVGI